MCIIWNSNETIKKSNNNRILIFNWMQRDDFHLYYKLFGLVSIEYMQPNHNTNMYATHINVYQQSLPHTTKRKENKKWRSEKRKYSYNHVETTTIGSAHNTTYVWLFVVVLYSMHIKWTENCFFISFCVQFIKIFCFFHSEWISHTLSMWLVG